MKHNIHFLAFSTVSFLAVVSLLPAEITGNPVASCSSPVCDFGTRSNRNSTNHVFVIENKGQSPLIISHIRSGCGCTQATLSTNTILPGQSATLKATLNLHGYVGPKRATIYLHTNDPVTPILQCLFTGIAANDVDITPRGIVITAVAAQFPSPPVSVSLVNKTSSPLNITGVSWVGTSSASTITTNSPGQSYTVTVGPFPKPNVSTRQDTLILSTDHPLYPRVEIPVSITLTADIAAFPPQLSFPWTNLTTTLDPRYVVIRAMDKQPFNIRSIEPSNTNIACRVQNKRLDWVRIRIGPFPAGTQLSGTIITIRTDRTNSEPIQIPITTEVE